MHRADTDFLGSLLFCLKKLLPKFNLTLLQCVTASLNFVLNFIFNSNVKIIPLDKIDICKAADSSQTYDITVKLLYFFMVYTFLFDCGNVWQFVMYN